MKILAIDGSPRSTSGNTYRAGIKKAKDA